MTYSPPAFCPAADLRWEATGPGVRRTLVVYNDDLLLVKAEFAAGAVGALPQHVHSQISYVESGEFEVRVGDDTRGCAAATPSTPRPTCRTAWWPGRPARCPIRSARCARIFCPRPYPPRSVPLPPQ